jgi:hypothetical protein
VVGKGPELAERELARFFIGLEEMHQQLLVEGAVGVGDERPGDAVDARQADQRLFLQDRQGRGSKRRGRPSAISRSCASIRWKLSSSHSAAGLTS